MVDKRPLQGLSVIAFLSVADILCAQKHTLWAALWVYTCVREAGEQERDVTAHKQR